MRYIIPINLINTILVAECFIKYIFKLYRFPNLIITYSTSESQIQASREPHQLSLPLQPSILTTH